VTARRTPTGGSSERGDDFNLAIHEDIELAARPDFLMAIDTPQASL
jgi:hypothetical protein